MHDAVAAKAGEHPQAVLDEADIRMAVAAHIHVGDDLPCDAQVDERRGADPRQLGELLEKLCVTVSWRVLFEKDGHQQSLAFSLDDETGVHVKGQRHPPAGERRAGDGAVERLRPDRHLQAQRAHEIGGPVAGADDHSPCFHHARPGDPPHGAGPLE